LAAEFPSLVRVFDTETSHEGRPIKAIVISRDESANHPVMFIDGGIHAREWAAHMSVVYLIFQLVERAALNNELLENLDWVIIPVVNPDGFVYSMNTERFWRKNRRPIAGSECIGVDNNRNFAYEWRIGTNVGLRTLLHLRLKELNVFLIIAVFNYLCRTNTAIRT
jgi:murein tripeptide amidase MpaA